MRPFRQSGGTRGVETSAPDFDFEAREAEFVPRADLPTYDQPTEPIDPQAVRQLLEHDGFGHLVEEIINQL